MLSKDFWIWSESFERGWVKRKSLLWGAVTAAGLSLGAKGRTKRAGAMGKAVKGGVHDGLSLLSGSWTGCHRSVLLPALL